MSSFSCSHFDQKEFCFLLHKECLPGRKGCVLKGKVKFINSIEERMKKKEQDAFKEYRRKTK